MGAPLEIISEFHERMERRGRCVWGGWGGRWRGLAGSGGGLAGLAASSAGSRQRGGLCTWRRLFGRRSAHPAAALGFLTCRTPTPYPTPHTGPRRCKLDLVFVTEEVERMDLVGLYPVNALRNKALMLSQTEVGGSV